MLSAYETGCDQAAEYPKQMKQCRKDRPSSRPRSLKEKKMQVPNTVE